MIGAAARNARVSSCLLRPPSMSLSRGRAWSDCRDDNRGKSLLTQTLLPPERGSPSALLRIGPSVVISTCEPIEAASIINP